MYALWYYCTFATDELFILTHRTAFGHQSRVLWFSTSIATTPGCGLALDFCILCNRCTVHLLQSMQSMQKCTAKNRLVVSTTKWLPWLQTSWGDSGYENITLVLEANCIKAWAQTTLQSTTLRTSVRESLQLHPKKMLIKVHCSSELSHGTCHFGTRYTGISNVYGNLKYQDLCMCKALS